MYYVQPIATLDLPELQPYRTMKRPVEHEAKGIFVAEGEKVVRRLLESDFTVVSVLLPEKWLAEFSPMLAARPENIPVYVVSDKHLLATLVGFPLFQGVMAIGQIPAPVMVADVMQRTASPRLFVAMDGLTNAENMGVVVRNCVAFNVQAMLVGETCASPYLRRAVRNSMGTVFRLPVVETGNLANSLRDLSARGVRTIAAHPAAGGKTLAQANFSGDCCVILGSEGPGISSEVLSACDETVAIPMARDVDSINVGNATAVFLYEACRQRGQM